jgi:hypothetical protein
MAGLAIKIGGDVSGFDRAMSTARNIALKNTTSIVTSFTGAAAKIDAEFAKTGERIGLNLAKGIGNGLKPLVLGAGALVAGTAALAIGYATVASAISQANAQIDRFLKLGQNSERAGVGVEFFQRFSDAAAKAKIDVADIEAALKRAGSVVTPKFEQEDSLRTRLNQIFESGYTGSYQSKGLADYNAAGTNEQRIRAAITAMQELRDLGLQTAAIEIGEKLFGSEVADRIRTGRLDIDAIAASLDKQRDDLITQQQVDQAAEFRERLDAAYKTIDDFFHVSVALEGSGRAVLDVWLMIAEAVAKSTTAAGNFYTKIQELQGPLGDYFKTVGTIVGGTAQILSGNLNDRASGTRTIYDKPIGPEMPGAPANAITNPPAPPRRALDLFLDKPAGAAKATKAPATPAESLDQVQTAINGIERSTEALKGEVDAIGKSAAERQTAINIARIEAIARQQGITLTEEQTAKVRDLSKATVQYRDAIEDARERQEALRSIGGDVLHGIADDARNGASALDILTSAVGRLASRLQDKALDSLADSLFGKSGGRDGSGLLGGLFSGTGGIAEGVKGLNLGSLLGINTLPTFATGVTALGIIDGPGTDTSDSIVARVSRGESIVKASATRRHRPLIEAMNADRLPAFAGGGMISEAVSAMNLPAAESARADTGSATSAAAGAGPTTTELHIHGGASETKAETSSGPMGPRMDVYLDKKIASMLMSGYSTREALKKISGNKLLG